MRWDDLFADLEAQAAVLAQRDRADEAGERARIEVGRLRALDRIRPAVGTVVSVRTLGAQRVDGVLRRSGPQWMLIEEPLGRDAIVATSAVLTVSGLGRWSADQSGASVVESRLGLRSALRGLARDRAAVHVNLIDSHELDGTIDRVGEDFVELTRHARGELRRRGEVHGVDVVLTSALAVIRREH